MKRGAARRKAINQITPNINVAPTSCKLSFVGYTITWKTNQKAHSRVLVSEYLIDFHLCGRNSGAACKLITRMHSCIRRWGLRSQPIPLRRCAKEMGYTRWNLNSTVHNLICGIGYIWKCQGFHWHPLQSDGLSEVSRSGAYIHVTFKWQLIWAVMLKR